MSYPRILLSKIIIELENGSRPPGGVSDIGDVPSIGAEHLNDFGGFTFTNIKRITHKFYRDMKHGKVNPQDILIVKDGATTGKISFVEKNSIHFPCAINEHVYRLSVKRNLVDPKYVYFYLTSTKGNNEILKDFRGATVGGISHEFINKVSVPLPPLLEQQKIANYLQKADRIRQLRRYARQLSDGYLQSVFLEMFGDPLSSKYPKIEIRRITENLDSQRIPIEASIRSNRKGIFPYYGASGIIDNIDGYLFNGENLLIAEDGANLVARSTPIAFIANGKYWVNNHAHVLRTKKDVDIRFLNHVLNSMKLDPYITGTAQPKLNAENLARIEVLFPPIKEQILFSSIVKKNNELSKKYIEAELQAEQLFQSLLHQAFCR